MESEFPVSGMIIGTMLCHRPRVMGGFSPGKVPTAFQNLGCQSETPSVSTDLCAPGSTYCPFNAQNSSVTKVLLTCVFR